MYRIQSFLGLCAVVLFLAIGSQAQQQSTGNVRIMRFNADDVVMLREIMAVVGVEAGKLRVIMIPTADRRPEGVPEVDLQRGDEVGMANGSGMSSLKELRKAYADTKAGAEFKLGVRRDGRPIIVTFVRKGENDMPKGGQMVIRSESGDENSDFFPSLGFGLKKTSTAVAVAETLPHADKEIRTDDVVLSINGKAVGTVADFAKELDATKIGEPLTIVLKRGDATRTVRLPRPEPRGQMRIAR